METNSCIYFFIPSLSSGAQWAGDNRPCVWKLRGIYRSQWDLPSPRGRALSSLYRVGKKRVAVTQCSWGREQIIGNWGSLLGLGTSAGAASNWPASLLGNVAQLRWIIRGHLRYLAAQMDWSLLSRYTVVESFKVSRLVFKGILSKKKIGDPLKVSWFRAYR